VEAAVRRPPPHVAADAVEADAAVDRLEHDAPFYALDGDAAVVRGEVEVGPPRHHEREADADPRVAAGFGGVGPDGAPRLDLGVGDEPAGVALRASVALDASAEA